MMWRIARRAASNLLDFCPVRGMGAGKRWLSSTIFVSRLSAYTTEKGFREKFSKFGTIAEVRLVRDERTNRPKGFGFVEFRTEAEAQKAIKAMNYKIVDGRLIFVELAKSCTPEEAHTEPHQNPPASTQH